MSEIHSCLSSQDARRYLAYNSPARPVTYKIFAEVLTYDKKGLTGMIARLRKWGLQGNLKTAHIVFLGIIAAASFTAAQEPSTPETTAGIFKEKCAPCHGDDGAGTTLGIRLHVKDLRGKEVQAQSSKVLADTVSAGKGLMPAFGTRLDSDQIQKLIEYVRHMPQK